MASIYSQNYITAKKNHSFGTSEKKASPVSCKSFISSIFVIDLDISAF